ncbi:hypothetical protein ACLI4Q_00255 [Natrialbaceae archaeon A-CW1-1]
MDDQPTDETDVFEEIDPDPDAVLDAFGVDSPEDVLASADGAHDPTRDESIDADDTVASELFEELERVARELEAGESRMESPGWDLEEGEWFGFDDGAIEDTETESDGPEQGETDNRSDATIPEAWRRAFERAAWTETRIKDEAFESARTTPSDRPRANASVRLTTESGFALVGPTPKAVRIETEAFGTGVDDRTTS